MTQEEQTEDFEEVNMGHGETLLVPVKGPQTHGPEKAPVIIEGQTVAESDLSNPIVVTQEAQSDTTDLTIKPETNEDTPEGHKSVFDIGPTVKSIKKNAREMTVSKKDEKRPSERNVPVDSGVRIAIGDHTTTAHIARLTLDQASFHLGSQIVVNEPTKRSKDKRDLRDRVYHGLNRTAKQLKDAGYEAEIVKDTDNHRRVIMVDTGNGQFVEVGHSKNNPLQITVSGPETVFNVGKKSPTVEVEENLANYARVYGVVLNSMSRGISEKGSKGKKGGIGTRSTSPTTVTPRAVEPTPGEGAPVGPKQPEVPPTEPASEGPEESSTVHEDLEWVDNINPRDVPRPLGVDARVSIDSGSIISDGDPSAADGVDLMRVDHERNYEGVITRVTITRFGRFVKGDVQSMSTVVRQEYDSRNLNSATEQNPIDLPLTGVNKDVGPAIRTDGSDVWVITRTEDEGTNPAIWRNGLAGETMEEKVAEVPVASADDEGVVTEPAIVLTKADLDSPVSPPELLDLTPLERWRYTASRVGDLIERYQQKDDGVTVGSIIGASGEMIDILPLLDREARENEQETINLVVNSVGAIAERAVAESNRTGDIDPQEWETAVVAIDETFDRFSRDEITPGQMLGQFGAFIDAANRLSVAEFDEERETVRDAIGQVKKVLQKVKVGQHKS